MNNFATKLASYAATVGVTGGELTNVQADAAYWAYIMDAKNKIATNAQDWTAFKNVARSGVGPLGAMPVAPVLAAPPAAVPADIIGRNAQLVGRIKKHVGLTEAIAQDLGIIGAEQTVDPTTMKPVLKLSLDAGQPNVGWKKQGMDAIEIQVDRGQGFVFLAIDTVPDYLDTADLPAAGASATWKYRAIYRLNDERVGQWSDVASISVMGA
jgi:hypothetical protein